MIKRLLKYPKDKSFFLFGPRGTGKTTWVKEVFKSSIYIDLLESELFNNLLANPGRLEQLIPPGWKDWVVIDEVQKIPELLNEIHRLIEKHGYKFVLTGSSARKLRRGGQNLLAGRALSLSFHPFMCSELKNRFDLNHSLRYGHLPCAYTDKDPGAYLASYVITYLKEEIQFEGLTRNLSAFSRFLESISFSVGSVLNISSVARDCSIKRKVVESYINILEDLLIGYRVPIFTKKSRRKLVAHPKFYFFDVGLYRTIRPTGPLDMPEEIQGMAVENLFFQELVAVNTNFSLGYNIYYWRTVDQKEVDFVLYGEKGLFAFEIKRTSRISTEMLKGLKLFLTDYPIAKAYLVYGGDKRLYIDNITVIPYEECLKEMVNIIS